MSEISIKQGRNRKKPEEVVQVLADKYDVSERYVRMVISGDRKNEAILEDYLFYKEKQNLLLREVKRIAPSFN